MPTLLQDPKIWLIRRWIDWRHRHLDAFFFIHINKTGGSSIKMALKIPSEHKTALEKIEEAGRKTWEKRYTFTVVRNPWDKVVSHYHYRVQTGQTGLSEQPVSFKEWVALTYGKQDPRYYNKPKMFMPQLDWISDQQGNVLVDDICRFENLQEDFQRVCQRIGKEASLPHLKASQRGHYREYYDAETVQIVADWFEKDIQYFEYQF